MRFLSISANNLDEFFMVRVAGLKGQVREGITDQEPRRADAGRTTRAASAKRSRCSRATSRRAGASCARMLAQARHRPGRWRRMSTQDGKARGWRTTFCAHIFPLLTPLAIDPAHPFPFIPNLGFTIALQLARASDGQPMNALIRMPNKIERFIRLPDAESGARRASSRSSRRPACSSAGCSPATP